ncbi:cytochrome P450 52A12 [Diutina catenulata]
MFWLVLTSFIAFYFIAHHLWYRVRERRFPSVGQPTIDTDNAFGIRFLVAIFQSRKDGALPFFLQDRHDQCQSDTFKVPSGLGPAFISTQDPENIKAVLATQFKDFCLGDRCVQLAPLLGEGIFTLDGVGWKHSRAMLAPQFNREQVSHVQLLEPHVLLLARHVANAGNTAVDLQELFFKLTLDVATEFLFGESVECLQDASVGKTGRSDIPGRSKFAQAFTVAQEGLTTRLLLSNLYWLHNPASFQTAIAVVHSLVDYYVDRVLAMDANQLDEASMGGYVFLVELVKQTRDRETLRSQALNILLAGRDTTAGLLSFLFYSLAKHPRVFTKLRDEVGRHFGVGSDADLSLITFESLKRCEYLKAVVNETLRLYPSVPNNLRTASVDTTIPRGGGPKGDQPVFVPKGQEILYNVFCMHRNTAIYGKDANEFRPERWSEPQMAKLGWAYLPFNGGPRICLGQQFALTEASYVTVRLLQMYGTLVDYNDDRCRLHATLTMSLMDGCRVGLVN